ncbi:ribonuclease III [Piscirickettsia salmonis]|uniref:Ribonuclease 3 n=1 Tax=Piscirickettsia salmonis TaxID=1238 RepID=A0A9Q6LTW8_PISSA|nr:ribonuclease III [Piscirickettsia salmonis]RNC77366.1 ribonuclease III [Piscirickettsiaceae bacterium NZ-RLO2]ALA24676.1 ribonuclease III [Piscirickettsia salmonis]APS45016.1 ribonuclease III [Piscirickettsia salmonis]APS48376.1 ribonuclease III [Piscirickettsia salmonis]APS49636.1 ribonuclease III [Piscirickettsia salmonis]
MIRPVSDLCKAIGHEFRNEGLLTSALTHRSVRSNNNERLEFLGDAILSFVIADALYERFPESQEGELSRFRANLVKGETLAAVANEFEIGQFLRLGTGELKSGGYRRESILADAVEAIIGAIYLDTGIANARAAILRWFEPRIASVHKQTHSKDAKTRLQEYLQANHDILPEYEVLRIDGKAHEQTFYVECRVSILNISQRGSGTSRRRAEQEAAAKILQELGQ